MMGEAVQSEAAYWYMSVYHIPDYVYVYRYEYF